MCKVLNGETEWLNCWTVEWWTWTVERSRHECITVHRTEWHGAQIPGQNSSFFHDFSFERNEHCTLRHHNKDDKSTKQNRDKMDASVPDTSRYIYFSGIVNQWKVFWHIYDTFYGAVPYWTPFVMTMLLLL